MYTVAQNSTCEIKLSRTGNCDQKTQTFAYL